MIAAEGLQLQRSAGRADIEAKGAIERFGRLEVRHGDDELVKRMNTQRAGLGRCRCVATDRGHASLPDDWEEDARLRTQGY